MTDMDMDSSFHQLEDAKARALHLLTCPLCTKQYEDPRVLPCQHTFCCRCLISHIDRVQSSRSGSTRLGAFPCPICFAGVGLPSAGVAAFPVDERINNIRALVVEEMAKDLASRLGRTEADDRCDGVGATRSSMSADDVRTGRWGCGVTSSRLDNISEQTPVGVDDADFDSGTWPSSTSLLPRFTDQPDSAYLTSTRTSDESVFSRNKVGYSSLRGAKSSRRCRPGTDRLPATSEATSSYDCTTSASSESRFRRQVPGYYSFRESRLRRDLAADSYSTQSRNDTINRSEELSAKSSSSFSNGYTSPQSPEPTRKGFHRTSSYADVTTNYSAFDNINRDDSLYSGPYTPIIGRNRLAYSSLRERRRRPMFDYNHFYDEPADFADEEASTRFASARCHDHEDRVSSSEHSHSDIQSHVDTFGQFESHRTQSSDHDRSQYRNRTAEQALQQDSQMYESDVLRASTRSRIGARRQRPTSLDPAGLTVLSNFVASTISTADSSLHSGYSVSSANDNSSNASQKLGDNCISEDDHKTHASEAQTTDLCAEEAPSPTHIQKTVVSHLDGKSDSDRCETDDVSSRRDTERQRSPPADVGDSTDMSRANSASPCSPDMSQLIASDRSENTGTMDEIHHVDVGSSSSSVDEGRSSPLRSLNESYFSRLTKFRNSKNSKTSRQSPSSTPCVISDSVNEEARVTETTSVDAPTPKPRYRKRPPAFIGTPFTPGESSSSAASASGEKKENQSADNGTSDGVSSVISSPTTNTENSCESPITDTNGSEDSPSGFESNDRFRSDNNSSPARWTAERLQDDDSAVYSADVDSDATVRSGTEQYMATPTSDDDVDDVNLDCCNDTTMLSDDNKPNHVIKCRLDDNDDYDARSSVTHVAAELQSDAVKVDGHIDRSERSSQADRDDAAAETSETTQNVDRSSDHLNVEQSYQVEEDDVDTDKQDVEKDSDTEDRYGTVSRDKRGNDVTDDSSPSAEGYVLATGLAALADGSLVVADYGGACVCISDDEAATEHRIIGIKPFSVATSTTSVISNDENQLIYIGDRRRKTLVVLDRYGSDVAQWPDNQFDWVCGIACLPDGQLAVLDRSRTRQLVVYTASGSGGDTVRPTTEFGGHGSGLGDLCMAEFVAADSRGRLLVADSGNHCVKAFDPRVASPGVVAVYGRERGSGEAQLEWPKGVTVDAADNVLVADCRNSRVVAFSVDGRPLGEVVPAVRGPYAVCALPTSPSRLAVSTYSVGGLSEFSVYSYDLA